MATAFPIDDDDGVVNEDNKHPIRIFFEDDDAHSSYRGRGGQRRGRGRMKGRGGREIIDDARSGERPGTDHSHRGFQRGRRNMRAYPRSASDRSSSVSRASNLTEGADGETNPMFRKRANSSSRHSDAGRGRGRGSDYPPQHRPPYSKENREETPHSNTEHFTPNRFDYRKLKQLSRKSPEDADDLLLEIASIKSGFSELLESDIQPEWIYNILQILSVAMTSSKKHTLIEVLILVEKHFLSRLSAVLGEISAKTPSHQNLWGNSKSLSNVCLMILKILKELVQTITTSLGKSKNILINVKEIVSDFNLIDEDENLSKEIQAIDELFRALVQERESRAAVEKQKSKEQRKAQKEEEGLPPEDFRELSILPRLRDVQMDEKPFLRANRSKGKYDDLDTYLDIQFRLLREDFIQPLRMGIAEYIRSVSEGNTGMKIKDIRLYRNVQLVRPVCTSDGISYIIQFDTSDFKRMNWTTSQRLKYGSLLCLSNDTFQTIFYATVKDRNPSDLDEGLVQVQFEAMPCTEGSETYLMAESTAYFEAFRHVLDGLQSVDSTMPFQRYFLECNTAIKPPNYLLQAGIPVYDFSSIMSDTAKQSLYTKVPVLNTTRWPKANDLDLDATQYEALQQAITKELAIIQGPPGTGKTFIGLKIAQILIENKSYWKPGKRGSPILVVCFTNHALDQFLEGILPFCRTGIVRVGGRCSSEALKPCILRNLKREKSKERSRSWAILQNEKDCLREMSSCQQEIHRVSATLKKTNTEIIPFNGLKDMMTYEQQDSFEVKLKNEPERNCMHVWLGFQGSAIFSDEREASDTIQEEHIAKKLWIDHLLKNVDEMDKNEAVSIADPTMIILQDRAKLYKTWILEFQQEVDKLRSHVEDSNKKALSSLLLKSKISMVHPNIMMQYIQPGHAKSQIVALLRTVKFETWLAIDGSKESTAFIKSVIDNPDNGKHDGRVDDMPDERELDADEDETRFDYDERDGRRGKLSKESEGNWLLKWDAKIERGKVQIILRSAKDISDESANRIDDVFRLDKIRRISLYKYWIKRFRESLKSSISESTKRFSELTERLKEVRDAETIKIMQEAQVIGMTTTGAAKYRKSLQTVKPSIVIVEEAAEVLESHIVTALSEGCTHLILIGDHKQLRPSTTVYELATRYQFDISLFERMIKNEMPCVTLSEQHRMRPEISCLMKNQFLYPNLEDHKMVLKYDHIRGIDSDVFFIEHHVGEVKIKDSTSTQNPHEAKFLAGLCKYLLQQGYASSQITILSPYMGQVTALRKQMPKSEFEGVRITAVDNFQGEENDIILLSLVRSRSDDQILLKKNPIGFLAIENRICVALSRAKKGLYVIGNFSHIKEYSRLWQHLVSKMSDSKRIGKEITLRCQNHPRKVANVSTLDDFKQAPDGGCKEPCGGRLKCGHDCPRVCHIIDQQHDHIKCMKPCPKKFAKCDHRCTKKCWEECGKCQTKVTKQLPMCKHTAEMPCHKDPYTWKCKEKCKVELPCGHECKRDCSKCTESKSHEDKCKEKVVKELTCKHSVQMNCFQDPKSFMCSYPCKTTLNCGHPCTGTCGLCFRGKVHKICQSTCEKTLPCGHSCQAKCSDLCPPCKLPCEWRCSHRRQCKKHCYEECDKCLDKCQFECVHLKKCTQLCHEFCDRPGCEERCRKILKCGHVCCASCGEPCVCSEFCSVKDNKYSSVYDKDTVYVKLTSCGCIIPQSLLDTHMNQPSTTRAELIKRCPDCSTPMCGSTPRYSNILKQSKSDVVAKYVSIMGTERERTRKCQELNADIMAMEIMGSIETGPKSLRNRLKPEIFGCLHIIGKSVELLQYLYTVEKKLKQLPAVTFVLEPIMLRALILKQHKYATSQFWDEIRREIQRIDYFVQLETLRQDAGSAIAAGSDKDTLYLRCINILTNDLPFNNARIEAVTKVIQHLKGRQYLNSRSTQV